jgi:hypothetical protein
MSDDCLLHTEDLGLPTRSGASPSVLRTLPLPRRPLRDHSTDGVPLSANGIVSLTADQVQ